MKEGNMSSMDFFKRYFSIPFFENKTDADTYVNSHSLAEQRMASQCEIDEKPIFADPTMKRVRSQS